MGIVAGTSLAAISRLKRTMAELPTAQYKCLENLVDTMSPTGAFKNYRKALQTKPTQEPALPYMFIISPT